VGEAALDQTEAELLEDEAKSLNAENTAAAAGRPWLNRVFLDPGYHKMDGIYIIYLYI